MYAIFLGPLLTRPKANCFDKPLLGGSTNKTSAFSLRISFSASP